MNARTVRFAAEGLLAEIGAVRFRLDVSGALGAAYDRVLDEPMPPSIEETFNKLGGEDGRRQTDR